MPNQDQGQTRDPKVLLYELNEVPWEVIDRYVALRPGSHTAMLLGRARCLTTVADEDDELQPWRTWPTFHTGLPAREHGSMHLGQDPEVIRGTPIWRVAEAAGLRVGLFGVLQTWPARAPANGGFYVPDTFARDAVTYPPELRRYQEFNLAMTRENTFSSSAPLGARSMALASLDLLRRGLTPWSVGKLLRQLVRERRDGRYQAGRAIFQVLPAFDLYWRLHRRWQPHLSIFFTNHVAAMMHRFWGDAFADYGNTNGYQPDPIFAGLIDEAMDVFDHQLGRLLAEIRRYPETVLVIAASMGQRAIPYDHVGSTYVLRDFGRFREALGLGPSEPGLAMFPFTSIEFPSEAAALRAAAILETVQAGAVPLFSVVDRRGRTATFKLRNAGESPAAHVTFASPEAPGEPRSRELKEVGIEVEERLGGGNTAHHRPDGPFLVCGANIEADSSRQPIELTAAGDEVLALLGLRDAARPRT
jgi:hypothetical protein